ncbi:MAG: hypothetical protein ACFFDW_04975 [Candidatus Thorarchaeota archaeon]
MSLDSICKECGSLLQADEVFCPNCGVRREEMTAASTGDITYTENYAYNPNPQPVYLQTTNIVPGFSRAATPPISNPYISSQAENLSPSSRSKINKNKAAQLSFEFGIISLFILPIIGSLVAIPAGIIGLDSEFKKQAIKGIVLGALGLIIYPLAYFLIFR